MTRTYTGIGSRETPPSMLALLQSIGRAMAEAGYVLRSGAADGADAAFEAGADSLGGKKEIFLPWKGFNGSTSPHDVVTPEAFVIAATVHPYWPNLGAGPKKLHGRNVYQVLGLSLQDPAELLVCWTKDGCESEAARTSKSGGTATAIVLAERHGVPIFNLRNDASRITLVSYLAERNIGVSDLLPEVETMVDQPGLF